MTQIKQTRKVFCQRGNGILFRNLQEKVRKLRIWIEAITAENQTANKKF